MTQKEKKPAVEGDGRLQRGVILTGRRVPSKNIPSQTNAQVVKHTSPGPVEILRDRRGPYGIGVPEQHDLEAIALAYGIDPCQIPRYLILRPDRFELSKPGGAALQMITGGFQHGPFQHCLEEWLRQYIHHEALRAASLPWPPPGPTWWNWWSRDKEERNRNRQIYHGLRCLSLTVINRMISEAIEAAANQDAIKAARRFRFSHREQLYRAGAQSLRALQFINVFPLAALNIFAGHRILERYDPFSAWDSAQEAEREARGAAHTLIERGARLRDVAAAVDIPTAFRRVKPGASHLVLHWLIRRPELLQWLPETTPEQRIWLLLINDAHHQQRRS
jgi:hypothetical protein